MNITINVNMKTIVVATIVGGLGWLILQCPWLIIPIGYVLIGNYLMKQVQDRIAGNSVEDYVIFRGIGITCWPVMSLIFWEEIREQIRDKNFPNKELCFRPPFYFKKSK